MCLESIGVDGHKNWKSSHATDLANCNLAYGYGDELTEYLKYIMLHFRVLYVLSLVDVDTPVQRSRQPRPKEIRTAESHEILQ